MAAIIFFVHPIAGSVNASLKTARELKLLGHDIYFLGLSRCKRFIPISDFNFIPLFESWFPDGEQIKEKESLFFWHKIGQRRRNIKHIETFLDALIAGEDKEFYDAIQKLNPKIMVVVATHYDSFIWALLSYTTGINTIYLHDTLCGTQSIRVPPITTDIIPGESIVEKLKIILAWKKYLFKRLATDFIYSSVLKSQLSVKTGLAKLCKHYKYPIKLIDISTDMLAPKLKLPEIVLCPKEFDFYDIERVGRYYAGASIDLHRKQPSFSWERVDTGKPLIYCALGSLNCLSKPERIAFFQIILDTAKQHQEWSWIVAVGDQLDDKNFFDISKNVVLVKTAPQLKVLEKTAIMINHGGTNTIKECIWFGVPMIVFPLAFDNYGNAARVAYQGLGLKGSMNKLTTSILAFMIMQIQENPYYRMQIKIMQKKFEEAERLKAGSSIINTFCF
ncbi:nucleotide disphospho-sugar-binding domain-containing protein [Methylomonas sp. BW4-1]|uniref:nucleotide disphospho-sugar-binding domain-containing protein n=1 Tax=Methylomonas sp. BW4-1 TaxID=3376685 RepID=UPI004041BFA3